jgi:hypothetical protein
MPIVDRFEPVKWPVSGFREFGAQWSAVAAICGNCATCCMNRSCLTIASPELVGRASEFLAKFVCGAGCLALGGAVHDGQRRSRLDSLVT